MNIPPIVGLVISLSLGIVIGGYGTYIKMDRAQIEADAEQVEDDNELAVEIDNETIEAKQNNTVAVEVVKWRDRPPVKIPVELTDNEIDTMCTNRVVPSNIVRAIRSEATKARRRFNDL